ncbi:MAG: hypothetical protein ACI9HY_000431 [Planctomycetaceae bacterium]|jgi:hypothetical protein
MALEFQGYNAAGLSAHHWVKSMPGTRRLRIPCCRQQNKPFKHHPSAFTFNQSFPRFDICSDY